MPVLMVRAACTEGSQSWACGQDVQLVLHCTSGAQAAYLCCQLTAPRKVGKQASLRLRNPLQQSCILICSEPAQHMYICSLVQVLSHADLCTAATAKPGDVGDALLRETLALVAVHEFVQLQRQHWAVSVQWQHWAVSVH